MLEDTQQVLYTPCTKGRTACIHPANPLSQESTCLLHTPVAQQVFQLATQQSEDEPEQVGAVLAMGAIALMPRIIALVPFLHCSSKILHVQSTCYNKVAAT